MAVQRGAYLKLCQSVIEIDGLFTFGVLPDSGMFEVELEEDIYFRGGSRDRTQLWADALGGALVNASPCTALACQGTLFLVHPSQVKILRYADEEGKT